MPQLPVGPGRRDGLRSTIKDATYDGLVDCPLLDINECIHDNLTSGHLNIPGGFGWLKFGLNNGNKCDWGPSLGMTDGGCQSSKTFLDEEIGPQATHTVAARRSGSRAAPTGIGSLTGNEWGDIGLLFGQPDPGLGADLRLRGRHRRERPLPHRRLRGDHPYR